MGKGKRNRALRAALVADTFDGSAFAESGGWLPAVCTNGHIFTSSVWASAITQQIQVSGSDVEDEGPCPTCGARGKIPDQLFQFADLVRQAVALTAPREREELRGLVDSAADDDDGSRVSVALARLGAHWSATAEFLRPKSGVELTIYLTFLLTVLHQYI